MKRKIKKSCKNLLWLWMVLILASCKKDTAPSEKQHDDVSLGSYVFETDWQYYMCNNINAKAKIQETENGCVFIHKGYLYRYEQGGSIMPLCANANCLHDQETDPEKQKECCAYLDYARTGDSFDRESAALMKYKDELFVCYDRTDHDPDTGDMCLMKIALDGSSKDMICRMKSMEYPLIHRGYLYYFSVEWSVKEEEEESQDGSMNDGVMENIGLHRMNIEKRNPKDEIVYRREGDHGFSAPQAYGKRIWFNTIGDQGKRRVSLIYNLETGQVEETGMEFPTIQVFQDKCYLKPYDQTKGDLDTTTLVEIDVYGNPVKTVLEGIIQISELMSDKNYFYISNAKIGILHPDIEFEETCQVYDKDFQLVDELKMPDVGYSFRDVPMGGDNYQYLLYSDEESGAFGLRIFDKSKIGSIKGNNCTYTIVKYGEEGEEQDIVPASAEESETPEMTPEYKISETSLNQEVSLSYSEPEDRQILGKMKKKHYLDTFSNDLIEAQVSYTVDKVKAVVTKSPMPLPEGPDYEIVLGQRYTIITTLFGYYTKGGRTFVRSITMTSINTTEPDVAELELPEDADEFIGVKAVIKGEFLRETWEPPSPEEGRVHNIWPPDIESYKDTWGCYDGKVAE